MRQNALTVLTGIKPNQVAALDALLSRIGANLANKGLIRFHAMTRVHFAAWVILPGDSAFPATLVLETTYDGDLEDHLGDLVAHGSDALDAVYCLCEGYPPAGSKEPWAVRQYLKMHSVKSAIFWTAFPGRSAANIRNAMAVRDDARRYLDEESRKWPLDRLTKVQLREKLTAHFVHGAAIRPEPSPVSKARLYWRLCRNVVLLFSPALLFFPFGLALLILARIHELREAKIPNPPPHQLDDRIFRDPPCALNHLTTLVNIKPGRLFLLKVILGVYEILGKTIFILGGIAGLQTVHFARWIFLNNNRRLLFLSNHDGSWSSYLGDFSDQGWGVTSIWSNTEGFPPARFLFGAGCRDIDAYAQWSRQHNVYAQVWYSAYPDETILNLTHDFELRDSLCRAVQRVERKAAQLLRVEAPIERSDLQGIIASGYNHLDYSRFLFVRIGNVEQARHWLQSILPEITTAKLRAPGEAKRATCLNLAFTSAGLAKMGLTDDAMATFPREFRMGMAHDERSVVLGDTGASSSRNWQMGGSENEEVHMLVMLYSTSAAGLEDFTRKCAILEGLHEVFRVNSVRHDMNEAFGFRDGISQPSIRGLAYKPVAEESLLKPGEFILGFENEYSTRSPVPKIPAAQDPVGLLPPDPKNSAWREFGRNGTYLVFRKLSQDVEGFWGFIDEKTKRLDGTGDPKAQELLAAKFLGRWRSGAPLVLAPDKDNPALGADKRLNNDFQFMTKDPKGHSCPIGSHIRRSNPRDSLPGGPAQSRTVSKRHQIIRRGRIYREPEPELQGGSNGPDQGLLFIALNADLRRQFEFIQQTWLNNPNCNGLQGEKDPLIGDNDGSGMFTVQCNSTDRRLHGLSRFVKVRGGGYFFLPGVKALNFLAGGI
jgi:Dyp-type peroxidase family